MPKIKKQTMQQISQMSDISNFTTMKLLMYFREQKELKDMTKKLSNLVIEKQEKFFDVWMYQVNDDIQSLAMAFGERFFLQHAYAAYEDQCVHNGAREILGKIINLHMITYLNDNMSWYLANGLISRQAAKDLFSKQGAAVKNLVPHINEVIESFGLIQNPMVHSPIARDYIKYNS
jgi:acyl-CoA oxidase